MMVNSVPSYSVSLDVVLSECTSDIPEERELIKCPNCAELEDELNVPGIKHPTFKECTGQPIKNYLKPGDFHPPSPKRWLVLAIYCGVSFMQVVVWNTWSPIATAAMYTFPSWSSGTVALFNNWGCLCFVMFIVPSCWMLNEKGLKFGCLMASTLCTIGSGIRLITMNELMFTILAHLGAIFNAIAGVIFGPSVVLMSSTWFPPHQRTSATGAGTAVAALGMAGSYLIGPLLISFPVADYPTKEQRSKLKTEIRRLLIFDFIMHLTLFLMIIICFPASPPRPPSHSSCISLGYRRNFKKCVFVLAKNGNVWLLGISAALSTGMTGPWMSQLTILFSQRNLSPTETAKLGFWTIISSCAIGVSVSRFSDLYQGHIKFLLLCLTVFATLMFFWIFCITTQPNFRKEHLIIAVISGFSASWATSALFYELGAEIAYPVPEGVVAGYIMSISSLSCVVVYAMFYVFQSSAMRWLNYGLVVYNVAAVITLSFVEEQYNRLKIDET